MSQQTIASTDFALPGQTAFQKGSVRDIYTIDDKYMVMVVTDRISAKDILPNWLITSPDPNVVIGNGNER